MNETARPAVGLISLGCAKNLVDSERLLGRLAETGFPICLDPNDADVVLVNTCGFIREAEEESLSVLDQCLEKKKLGGLAAVVALGCLPARWGSGGRLEGVDGWFGISDTETIVEFLSARASQGGPRSGGIDELRTEGGRFRLTPDHLAYLRITEGCDNRCSYCTIPSIRGPLRCKPLGSILEEAEEMVLAGATELVLIGQDTAAWRDGGGLGSVLEGLAAVEGVEWIRVMYAHPAHIDSGVVNRLANGLPVVPYLDLPVQHASDPILKALRRKLTAEGLRRVVETLRSAVNSLVLRTTVMVGFPGESEEDFLQLLRFVSWGRFERLGAFLYSPEPGTAAAALPGRVRPEVANRRLGELLSLAARIRDDAHTARVGEVEDAVSDGFDGEWTLARTTAEAPEVDPVIWIPGRIPGGVRGRVRIEGLQGPDLVGTWIDGGGN